METASSQLPRIVRLALIGAATAFAWLVVSLVLGFGLGQAHADDTDDEGLLGGALGAVTSLVDTTASTVTGTVSNVTTGVTAAVNTAVAAVPAPAQQPVGHVAQAVGAAVSTVTRPVSEVVSGGVVSGIATPVVEVVADVPVVGGLVTRLGLDDAVTDLGATADTALGALVGAVDETSATIGRPAATGPAIPGLPGLPNLPGLWGGASAPDSPAGTAMTDAATALLSPATAFDLRSPWAAASRSVSAAPSAALASAAPFAGGLSPSAGGLCLPTASAGPGGAGPGAWALAALLPIAAHRAWVRRAGPDDEHAPPAPPGSTDVSPD